MSHHSGYPFGNSQDEQLPDDNQFKSLFDAMKLKTQPPHPHDLGATGKFPNGKLTDNDEGEIKIGITSKDGKVVIDFGKPTHWIGFTPEQAVLVATSLIKRAGEASGKPVQIEL